MKKTNILFVDDHAAFRDGICVLLRMEPFAGSVYDAWDEKSFTNVLDNHPVDVILLDIRLRGTSGLELLKKIRSSDESPYVIAFTGLEGVAVIMNLMMAKIDGIVHKFDGYNAIVKAIESTFEAKPYFSTAIRQIIDEEYHNWGNVPPVVVSDKEKEFIKAIAKGLTINKIAPLFNMTPGSAEQFRIKLMRKTGVPNAYALLEFAFRNGII